MVKKILCQGYLWLLLLLLYAPIFDHYDLFVYRSKGAGQLDRVFPPNSIHPYLLRVHIIH